MANKKLLGNELSSANAEAFLRTCQYIRQRQIDPAWVRYLAAQILLDHFDGDITFVMIAVLPNGTKIMINGYHTCLAVITASKPIRINIFELPCKDMAEVDMHYTKIDRGKRRGADAVDRAYGFNLGRDATLIRSYNSAVTLIMMGFRSKGGASGPNPLRQIIRDDSVMTAAKKDWLPYINLFFKMTDDISEVALRRPFLNAGVMATAMVCLRYSKKHGKEFWAAVINPDGIIRGDPAMALRDKLQSVYNTLQQHSRTRVNVAAHIYAHMISYAWNAKILGNDLTNVSTVSAATQKRPLLLRDTPYDGLNYFTPTITGIDLNEEMKLIESIQIPEFEYLKSQT